jgi:FHA domain-containing protein
MPLILRAVSLNELPITQPISARFGAQGGSIGRADSNTLALPDPERRISRRQADVSLSTAGYVIKNVGSANPIIVREQSLAQGDSAPLRSGDQVRIGGYLLEVSSDGDDDRTAVDRAVDSVDPFAAVVPGPQGIAAREPSALPAASPFAGLGPAVSPANPFADLLGGARSGLASAVSAPASAPVASRLPDDFDPFAPPSPPAPAAAPQLPGSVGGAFDDLVPTTERGSIDALFGLTPSTSASDPLAAFMAGTPVAAEAASAASSDPLAMFANAREPIAPVAPSIPDHTPELRAGFVPPKPVPPPGRVSPPSPAPSPPAAPPAVANIERRAAASPLAARAASAQSAAQATAAAPRPATPTARDDESTNPPATAGWSEESLAVWHYLCEGAGVRLDPPPNTGPAFMRVVGMMLRSAVEGTVQQMAMRQATRQELQAQVTVIRPKNNNPLKFAPDGQSAMEQMLQPAVRGFLPGPAAMTDAMHDLLGHAIGTMAGTRAALEGVLKRFGPQELEAKLASKSVLDSVLPMNRKAKLWELYLQHYGSIRDEAQEDFHALFGRAFLAAYEQQLERLRRDKASAPAAPK